MLEPLSARYDADLYLPSGESSDSQLALMARTAVSDGRPMVVFVLADCDPAGRQMAVSIGHKLRMLKETVCPGLRFRLVPLALTVEQVKLFDLPSTPLKETEKRAGAWFEAYGVEQTDIDALATLRPDLLRRLVDDAVEPYFDATLRSRMRDAQEGWEAEAQEAFDEQVDAERLEQIRANAETALEALRAGLKDLETETDELGIELPEPELPEPEVTGEGPALVDSEMPLERAIAVLKARKDYKDGGEL